MLSMLQISLADEKIVSADALKTKWRIPPEQQVMVDDDTFVKVVESSFTLLKFVTETNEAVGDDGTPIDVQSIRQCRGYQKIMTLRNNASDASGSAGDAGSTLFGAEQCKPSRRSRPCHAEIKSKRFSSTIELELGDGKQIVVLAPGKNRDALWLQYNSECLANAIDYMRSHGFSPKEAKAQKRSDDKNSVGIKCKSRRRAMQAENMKNEKSESSGDRISVDGNDVRHRAEEADVLSQTSSYHPESQDVASEADLISELSDKYEASQTDGFECM